MTQTIDNSVAAPPESDQPGEKPLAETQGVEGPDDDERKKIIDEIMDVNRTSAAVIRVAGKPIYSPPDNNARFGYFNGRRIIGRDCPVNAGVYLGGGAREAIVVDDMADNGTLKEVYGTLIGTIFKKMGKRISHGVHIQDGILDDTFAVVLQYLPYNEEMVNKIIAERLYDNEIFLSEFIDKRGGQCRHEGLLAAYLLEKLIQNKLLAGHVSVERNYLPAFGAHAWARYTGPDGRVFIIDPAMGYIGPIEEAEGWFYEVKRRLPPEEQYLEDLNEKKEMEPAWEREIIAPKVSVQSPLSSDINACVEINGSMDFNIKGNKLEVFVCGIRNPANTVEAWEDGKGEIQIRYFSKVKTMTAPAKKLMDSSGAIHIVKNDDRREVQINKNSPFNHCSLIINGHTITVTDYKSGNGTEVRVLKNEEKPELQAEDPVPGAAAITPEKMQRIDDVANIELRKDDILVLQVTSEGQTAGLIQVWKEDDEYWISYEKENARTSCPAKSIMRIPGTIFIGRKEQNDICIRERQVSKSHCKIKFEGDSIEIMDNNSMHGTFFMIS